MTDTVHRGSIVACDTEGKIVFEAGNGEARAFLRSAAKPLQAIPLVKAGGMEKFGLTRAELAIICASHKGEDVHLQAVRSILSKIGCSEDDLECGSGFRDNCTGKHSGMLAQAKLFGESVSGYWRKEHPVQQRVFSVVAELTGREPDDLDTAMDGCGVPTFHLSIRQMAMAYARIAAGPAEPGAGPFGCIMDAMLAHPEMVCGPRFRDFFGNRVFGKSGAAGVFCCGLPGKGIGLAMKIEDGNSEPRHLVIFDALRRMGVLTAKECQEITEAHQAKIYTRRGEPVGEWELCY